MVGRAPIEWGTPFPDSLEFELVTILLSPIAEMSLPGLNPFPYPLPMPEAPPQQDAPAPAPAPVGPKKCANCGSSQPPPEMRCSKCRKVNYCGASCAKSDWTFHKRICVAPAPAPAPASGNNVVLGEDDLDEDDRAAIEEVKKRGYRCVRLRK